MGEYQDIVKELKMMVEADQAMRHNPQDWDEAIDHQNTERMKAIIEKIGWPTISKVASEGSHHAWLLVQHADHDPEFQKKCLKLMKSEPEGEVSKRDIAYLEDRIAIAEGRPQIYGTQFHRNIDGQLEPFQIQDPDNVNKIREEMGMETLSENIKRLKKKFP